MSAVSVQTVLAWLNYWALPPQDSYSQWGREFNHIPTPPPEDPETYLEAATWIAANYDGPAVPLPPASNG